MKNELRAGVSLIDISPDPGLELAGYPHHPRYNKGIHDPLYAACIYLENGITQIAIVTMDLLMYSKKEVLHVRREIERKTGIPETNVMIACSHTHSGPWTSGRLDMEAIEKGLKPDANYMVSLRTKIVDLVVAARKGIFDASIGIGQGYCGREQGVGGNRRNPNDFADPEVWVLGVKDATDTLRGILVRYALHPTFLHSDNLYVSADYPGCIRNYFRIIKPEAVFLFAQGPSGNQSPRYFRKGKIYEEALRVGTAIGQEANRVLETLKYESNIDLLCISKEIDLDLRAFPPREDAERNVVTAKAKLEEIKASSSNERDIWNAELHLLGAEDTLGYIKVLEKGGKIDLLEDELPAEVQVLGIGDARIVGIQGELFAEYGFTIQYRSPFDSVFVIELANGVLPGYACTTRAYTQGGYEPGTSLLSGSAGEQLVDVAVNLLKLTK